MNLTDKVIVITGASRGIGKEVARLASKEGAKVVINFRVNKKEATNIVKEIKKISGDAIAIKANVRKMDQMQKMVAKIIKKWGRIDILINNAGILGKGYFSDVSHKIMEEVIDTNIKGVINTTKAVLPVMLKQRDGVIVNISSGAGKTGLPKFSVYSASKFAVLGFTESLGRELEEKSIRVYAVCPGQTATDMTNYEGMPPSKVAKRVIDCAKEALGLSPGENTEIYK